MLLIDGVKYQLWEPKTEDEFEQVVKEHTHEIFGENSIFLDRKQKLKSLSGIGSIPDGYVIILGSPPQWHIVEVELSTHPLHDHIISQVSKFINGINSPSTKNSIVNSIYDEITKDAFLRLTVEQTIKSNEIYKFVADLLSKPPVLTIVIEKETEELTEAISTLAHPEIKVVEFQTFAREGAEAVHAHLFEPLYPSQAIPQKEVIIRKPSFIKDTIVVPAREEGFKETFLGENRWYEIRISASMIPQIKYIAAYQVAPISAITHWAQVRNIELWETGAKYVVNFLGKAKEIGPIQLVPKSRVKALQNSRYTSFERLQNAKTLDDVL